MNEEKLVSPSHPKELPKGPAPEPPPVNWATCQFCGERVPAERWGKPHGFENCAKYLKSRVEKLERDIISIKKITDNVEPNLS